MIDIRHRETSAELARLELAYERALHHACSERSPEAIASAFDEADRLQRCMLVAGRHLRMAHAAGADRRAA